MKKDIESGADIRLLVNTFYQKVLQDEDLGIYFEKVLLTNWEGHLQTMYDFWDNILFYSGSYSGNPMHLHKHIHHLQSIEAIHFKKWVHLFTETCHELFSGTHAENAIQKVEKIAAIMEKNIQALNHPRVE